MRVLLVVHIGEHLLNVVPIGDTLSFEKLLSFGYLAIEEKPNVFIQKVEIIIGNAGDHAND